MIAAPSETCRAGDLTPALPGTPAQRSIAIRGPLERGLIAADEPGRRIHHLSLGPHELTPFVVGALDRSGFIPSLLVDSTGASPAPTGEGPGESQPS
jgi:hypothetical protein